jgi:hypothetical protein
VGYRFAMGKPSAGRGIWVIRVNPETEKQPIVTVIIWKFFRSYCMIETLRFTVCGEWAVNRNIETKRDERGRQNEDPASG